VPSPTSLQLKHANRALQIVCEHTPPTASQQQAADGLISSSIQTVLAGTHRVEEKYRD
jgi:hypothetical protein